MNKKTALVLSPAIGLLVVLGTLAVPDSNGRWLGFAVLVIFFLAHQSSVRRAAR